MPLITGDFQLELRSTLMGDGTFYRLAGPIRGLGNPPTKSNDMEFVDADGSYGGRDRTAVRVLTIPLFMEGTPEAVMGGLETMNAVWATSTVDLPLVMRLPGWDTFSVSGRPRGPLDEDLTLMPEGVIHLLATFVALEPTITYL